MLKFIMTSMEGVDPAVSSLYSEKDGKFVLTGIENTVHKSKLDEFRTNNIDLSNKLKTFEGIDVNNVKAITQELEEARIKLKDTENFDEKVNEIVEQRVKTITDDFTSKEQNLNETVLTQGRQLESLILDGSVTDAAVENKIRDSAITDVMLRAKETFKVENGEPIAYDNKKQPIYGPDGVSKLSVSDWVKGLVKTSPHLFQESVTGNLDSGRPGFSGDASKLSALQKIQGGLA